MPAKKSSAAGATAEPPAAFEQAIERLEQVVEELEGGELTLEQSLACYEEGVKLSRQLTRTLDDAEKRIEKLMADPGGEPVTAPLDLELKPGDRDTGEGQLPF
ncbi:MAG: exodeoxyribonuclease VII small subunit [Candidatus Eiseniibacteriota bacterium]